MPGGIHPPLEIVANWPVPNYTNPQTSGGYIVVLVLVLLALCYVVVLMRLWARFLLGKNAGIDDALIVFNMLPLTGLDVAMILAMTQYGFDRHIWDVPPGELVNTRKITMAGEMLYMVSTTTTKISILLFYRRLVSGSVSHTFLYVIYAAIAFVIAYFCVFFFAGFAQCRPISAIWMQGDYLWYLRNKDTLHCLPEGVMVLSSAAVSTLQDFLACGMPLILFWQLRIPTRQKVMLGAVFSIGFFLCICGILRIYYIDRLYYKTYDTTWEAQPAWLWLIVEANLAVICASAPALKVFFKATLDSPSSDYAVRHTPTEKRSKSSLRDFEHSLMEEGTTKGPIKMTWGGSAVNGSNGSMTSVASTRQYV